jgi:cytochrome P450
MPEWSWLTGHLLVLKEKLDRLPADASPFYAFQDLVYKDFADTEIFVMDYWPMYEPSLMITSPEISAQVSNEFNLQRDERELKYFGPVVGGPSLITMTNEDWEYWRTLFNPAFSSTHMLNLVPSIVDSVEVFCDLLRESVGKGIVILDDKTGRLTMEIITKATL